MNSKFKKIFFSVMSVLYGLSFCSCDGESETESSPFHTSGGNVQSDRPTSELSSTSISEVSESSENDDNFDDEYNSLETIPFQLYSKDGNQKYDFDGDILTQTDESYVHIDQICEWKINADYECFLVSDVSNYYINSNQVELYYCKNIPNNVVDEDGYQYKVYSDDSTEKIVGIDVGEVRNSAFIVLKSFDKGETWIYDNVSYVNIGNEPICYRPSGEDIQSGVTLMLISVVKMFTQKVTGQRKKWIFWPFSYEMEDIVEDFYITLIQKSEIFIVSNIINPSFYCDDLEYNIDSENEYEIELINKCNSLTDGSVTFSKVTYSSNGNSSLYATCSYNDGLSLPVDNNQEFSKEGKYKFTVTNNVNTKEYVIYIMNKEKLFASYFGDNIISQSTRVYDSQIQIPLYMIGSKLSINIPRYGAPIYGKIYEIGNNELDEETPFLDLEELSKDDKTISYIFDKANIYCLDAYIGGKQAAGQKVKFRFYFQIVNRPLYRPEVNYLLLSSPNRLINMALKAYAVNFYTTRGGAYVFLFPATISGYEEAEEFAFDIEKRFVMQYDDKTGKYYYYRGERYDSKVELYEKMVANLNGAIYLTYTNPNETYGIDVLPEEKLDKVENQILEKDVRVCLSNEIKAQLLSSDIIINNFEFTQIVEYESSSVRAIDKNGNVYEIPYGVNVNDVLKETGKYTIEESNWNGTHSYEVIYFAEEINTGEINIEIDYQGEKDNCKICWEDDGYYITADRIIFKKSNDDFDSQTLVVIKSLGFRMVCLLSEISAYIYDLKEEGIYEVELINRMGCSFKFTVEISGNYISEEYEDIDYVI